MVYIDPNSFPYETLAHWPPMTYRTNASPSTEEIASFSSYLKTENDSKEPKELQPWIPFCEGKCAFCYFPVYCDRDIISTYIGALTKSLEFYAKSRYVKSSIFNELYIGGGSPSVLSENQIKNILDYCRKNFNLSNLCATKFTACTYGLTNKKIEFLASNNVDQLDIGIQTFDENFRKILMLRDSAKEAKQKLEIAKKNGLNLSIDLLYNLPGQSVEQWKSDLKQALELEVESVDCYPLDLYDGTPLAKKIASGELPSIGDFTQELEMYLEAFELFKKHGYYPTCHNRFSKLKTDFEKPSEEVIGTGAGFFMGIIGNFQYSDVEDVKDYINCVQNEHIPLAKLSKLTLSDEMRKAAMMIYVRVPINRSEFKSKFGLYPEEAFPKAFEELRRKDLIDEGKKEIRLSEKGDPWRFNIAWEFFK